MTVLALIAQAAAQPDAAAAIASAITGLLGPAGVAGAMLLWLTYVVMPRQEKAAERREHACEEERGRLVTAFREEMAIERAAASADRGADRASRHEDARHVSAALASVELAIRREPRSSGTHRAVEAEG